jgi:hypothetical protein
MARAIDKGGKTLAESFRLRWSADVHIGDELRNCKAPAWREPWGIQMQDGPARAVRPAGPSIATSCTLLLKRALPGGWGADENRKTHVPSLSRQ